MPFSHQGDIKNRECIASDGGPEKGEHNEEATEMNPSSKSVIKVLFGSSESAERRL